MAYILHHVVAGHRARARALESEAVRATEMPGWAARNHAAHAAHEAEKQWLACVIALLAFVYDPAPPPRRPPPN
ncbi:MAG: hypothetical protein AAGH15_19955 [Myxococcota bacterium]